MSSFSGVEITIDVRYFSPLFCDADRRGATIGSSPSLSSAALLVAPFFRFSLGWTLQVLEVGFEILLADPAVAIPFVPLERLDDVAHGDRLVSQTGDIDGDMRGEFLDGS